MDKWIQESGRGQRPSNSSNSHDIMPALVRCGFDVLPDLLDLIEHPHAHQLVFGAIARILAKPWYDRLPSPHMSPGVGGKEAKARRDAELVMLQPDPTLQASTDQAARKLAERLTASLQLIDAGNATVSSGERPRQVNRPSASLLMALAIIPSPECLHPLWDALSRDDINEYTFIDVLCSLVRQGASIDDARVAQRMQNQWEKDVTATWLDQSAQYRFGQLNSLLYFVRPITLLGKPLTEYLPKWIHICRVHYVMRNLQTLFNDEAYTTLVYLARDPNASSQIGEELAYAIAGGLTLSTFELFLELLKDGTFFRLQRSAYHIERMASHVAEVISTNGRWRASFIATCSEFDNDVADALACSVLIATQGSELDMIAFGLRVLDNHSRNTGRYSATKMLLGLFTRREPLTGDGMYEVYPRSNNMLRKQLFDRALGAEQCADRAKIMLCEIEASRREMGRPTDEPRHPDIVQPIPWSDVLVHKEITESGLQS